MPADGKTFLMMFSDDDYGQTIFGHDEASAVEGHYGEMDMWCPPRDPELDDEFIVKVYELPQLLEAELTEKIEALACGEFGDLIREVQARFPSFVPKTVNVVYTYANGASASVLEPMPDLFTRLG